MRRSPLAARPFAPGSSNLWIPAANCSTSCYLHARFDASKSDSYGADGRPFAIDYASGPVSGYLGRDVANMGGIAVTNFTFAEITDASGLGLAFAIGQFDGICGMAFGNISVDSLPPLFVAMVQQGLVDEPIFSFFLENTGQNGELTIGGVDSSHYTGDFQYVDLTVDSYFEVALNDFSVPAGPLTAATKAVLDTGTSLLALPTKDVEAFAKTIGATPITSSEVRSGRRAGRRLCGQACVAGHSRGQMRGVRARTPGYRYRGQMALGLGWFSVEFSLLFVPSQHQHTHTTHPTTHVLPLCSTWSTALRSARSLRSASPSAVRRSASPAQNIPSMWKGSMSSASWPWSASISPHLQVSQRCNCGGIIAHLAVMFC